MTTQSTPVMFRVQRSGPFKGSVTAVFPDQSFDYFNRQIMCFDLLSGHGGCAAEWLRGQTRPATPEEAAPTRRCLEQNYGYTLAVVQRRTPAHRARAEIMAREARRQLRENPAGAPFRPLTQDEQAAVAAA